METRWKGRNTSSHSRNGRVVVQGLDWSLQGILGSDLIMLLAGIA